ncbi:uncharacterized protein YlbG [Trichonephila clavata]|uniref:Uncharacterized protein YlbG n=1 Tax=Trichonephila clavata TaxID=2740835 RepID=A0A8X6HZG2_TRICU|nr:uncharacterized protein YlbG [Trichonephila clavata]
MGFKEDQMVTVSLYARVSSGKQAQENTIASQVAALERQISVDGYELLREYKFIDNGYSGSNLVRPNLEKLRDRVAEGKIDKIYIHSPDRLSRKYAYQMILLEEFQKAGAEAVFLNYEINDNPESQLLLQMQGMIAEYERAKIMERSRRGKIYAANKGCVSVMGGAPYGYRYIDKCTGVGQALFEINEEEADVVRKVFLWVGRERASIGEVCRRLNTMSIITRTGKKCWDRSVIWGMLKNPAYKGQAAFGKTKVGVKLQHIRPQRHSCEQPKDNYSIYPVEKANWIYVKVPNIVNEDVFDIVQEQLAENRKIARTRERGAKYLLQGLIVCKCCRYAYYGSPVRNKRGEKVDHYAYYRCIGRDSYRFGGNKICDNKHIRTDALETAVWEEVKHLLKNPNRILEEYKRKLSEFKRSSWDKKSDLLEKQENKLQRGIARLIDSYAQEYISQEEFEPRVKAMKQSLKAIEEEKKRIFDQKKLKQELTLVVTNLEDFSSNITSNLDNADWITKRDIIRTLVKRIEINLENKEEKEKPIQRKRRHQPRHHIREQRYLHGEEDLESRGTSRSIENDNYVIRNNKATSGASKPSSWINVFANSIVDAVKSIPRFIFSSFKPAVGIEHFQTSKAMTTQGVDVNGTLLLLDVFIRKITGQKYISSSARSIPEQEALGYALNIIEGFKKVVEQARLKSGVSMHRLNIDFVKVQEEVTRKITGDKFSEIAEILNSYVEKACPGREAGCTGNGIFKDTFYRFKELYETGGEEALQEISKSKPLYANRVSEDIEKAVIEIAIEFPAYGQERAANELKKRGILISASGIRSVWQRNDLENFKKRLKALEAKVAQDGIILTEEQITALEKAKEEKEAHGEIETEHPGYLGSQDSYYVGNIKGIGRIYQQTFVYSPNNVANFSFLLHYVQKSLVALLRETLRLRSQG